jgi:hypothetical protein
MADPALPVVDPAAPAVAAPDQAMTDTINAAVTAHIKRALGGLPGLIEAQLAPLREQFAARPAAGAKPDGSTLAGDGVAGELAALKAQLKSQQDQAASERKAAREANAFQALRTELGGKVRPEALDAAAKLIMHADRRVMVSDDGSVTFKHGDADYGLKEGVAAYLKSPDAALFLPAPNGTSQRPGQRVPGRPPAGGPPPNETPMAKTLRLLAGVKAG